MKDIAKDLEVLFKQELTDLCEKHTKLVELSIIKPFCDKYGLAFHAGMGAYYLTATENYKGKKSWLQGHYYGRMNGKYLNEETKNKEIQHFFFQINSVYEYINDIEYIPN